MVIIEDHVDHIDELLDVLHRQWPELLPRLTVMCLDERGLDTQAALERWTSSFPELRVVASMDPSDPQRQQELPAEALQELPACARVVRGLLAPRGVLLQDIQLETLSFVPDDRCWESIDLASMVRGKYPSSRAPRCNFMSNKRVFHARFAADMEDAGFSFKDVLDKDELETTLVPRLARLLRKAFPLELERTGRARSEWLTADAEDRQRVDEELDLVLWEDRPGRLGLAGVGVDGGLVEMASDGQEALGWRALVKARLRGLPGIRTRELGEAIAPEHAERAEQLQKASNLVNRMRSRLRGGKDALLNTNGHYCLADERSVGRVRRRPRSPGSAPNASIS